MKLYFFALLLLSSSLGFCQDVNIPDANFLQNLRDAGVDTNWDGKIQISEAEAVDSLRLNRVAIESIEGISSFSNLRILLNNNAVSELDLSENEKLENIYITNTRNLVSLELPRSENLKILKLTSGDVSDLDLTRYLNLEYLEISYLELTNLDLSQNVNLLHLETRGIELINLDLSQNVKLEHLETRDIAVSNIDLSQNQNLEYLEIYESQLTSLDLSQNENLEYIEIYKSEITSLDLSQNAKLNYLDCSDNILEELLINNPLLTHLDCHDNELSTLEIENASKLEFLDCGINNLIELNASTNPELTYLNCRYNDLTNLDVSNTTKLKELNCYANDLTELDVTSCAALRILDFSINDVASIDISQNPNLIEFHAEWNELQTMDFSNNDSLQLIECERTALTSIDLSNNPNLEFLYVTSCELTRLDVSSNPKLKELKCSTNKIEMLNLENNSELELLYCSSNELSTLDLSYNTHLTDLNCAENDLGSIDLEANKALERLTLRETNLDEINISHNTNLVSFYCDKNQIRELDVSQNTLLLYLHCDENLIEKIDLSNNKDLFSFSIETNPLTELDLTNNLALERLFIGEDSLSSLDLSHNSKLELLDIIGNSLQFLNLKNDTILEQLRITDTIGPLNICVDLVEYDYVNEVAGSLDVAIFTDCSFGFGEDLFEIQGTTFFSSTEDCTDNSEVIDNPQNGIYRLRLVKNTYHITPFIEHEDLFEFNPSFIELDLDGSSSPFFQDFCIYPKGSPFADLQVTIIPVEQARPGFETDYKILFENKGNVATSGTLLLDFPFQIAQYLSSTPALENNGTQLSLVFEDLKPFEQREVSLTFRLNSPMDNPPLTDGIINFTAEVFPDESEYVLSDNKFSLEQQVVNSYDPNDKTCLQGNTVLDEMIGSYVDYLIRFENEGTASAVNVTILDEIDNTPFEISSLKITDSSHPVQLSVDNDVAQFIFENIELPFEEDFNKGHVAFQVKTWSDLNVGDSINNTANIYFDFNFPIQTNTAIAEIVTDSDGDGYHNLEDCDDENAKIYPGAEEEPGNGIDEDCNGEDLSSVYKIAGNEISIYPNPASNFIFIDTRGNLDYVASIYDLNGIQIYRSVDENEIRIDSFTSGIYILEIEDLNSGQKIFERIVIEN